ncbi:hypothetical protein P9D34_22190 [Bacillus swezeyi]|nr:hypothetical protein [Bacillus swezeyi]MEC1263082.1 hypothetical protein [Bacillus swezeyi]MED2930390.1 hypothetical protein [Bacillus swezeyi]MED2963932.1 hypothetical protein [Bacillus swezeyi]MED2975184.1 hypothetical protein [Bacillus swezeyi]MED3074501.1 hypothetical protein [Bacillus swezeyi]
MNKKMILSTMPNAKAKGKAKGKAALILPPFDVLFCYTPSTAG